MRLSTGRPQLEEMRRLLAASGFEYEQLISESEEVVLFGSVAAGLATSNSDVDLLLVGNRKSSRGAHADIIGVSPAELRSSDWLGSELANHVSTYGFVLKGGKDWAMRAQITNETVSRKRMLLRRRLDSL